MHTLRMHVQSPETDRSWACQSCVFFGGGQARNFSEDSYNKRQNPRISQSIMKRTSRTDALAKLFLKLLISSTASKFTNWAVIRPQNLAFGTLAVVQTSDQIESVFFFAPIRFLIVPPERRKGAIRSPRGGHLSATCSRIMATADKRRYWKEIHFTYTAKGRDC
jgi:hypothetical protein